MESRDGHELFYLNRTLNWVEVTEKALYETILTLKPSPLVLRVSGYAKNMKLKCYIATQNPLYRASVNTRLLRDLLFFNSLVSFF